MLTAREFMDFLHVMERLKCNVRHGWTSTGRRESVAEHSYRLCVMAFLLRDEFPGLDMEKVLHMCIIHDWGEAVTGDIPTFLKTEADEATETDAVAQLTSMLPDKKAELDALFAEMEALETPEAKLYKAIDRIEAVIQHNEAPLDTWIEPGADAESGVRRQGLRQFPVHGRASRAGRRRYAKKTRRRRIKHPHSAARSAFESFARLFKGGGVQGRSPCPRSAERGTLFLL